MREILGPLPLLPACLMLLTATLAAAADLRTRKIPNFLTVSAFFAGFAVQWVVAGPEGLARAAAGAGLALLIYFPLFLLRGMGAGDVKLMAALGALAGARVWFWIFFLSSVTGAVAGLLVAFSRGRLRQVLINTGFIVRQLVSFRNPAAPRGGLADDSAAAVRLPHGAAIAFAVWVVVAASLAG